jgi:bacterioferritin
LIDITEGPVTPAYGLDADDVIEVLNDVIATEIVSWLRYQQHALVVTGVESRAVSRKFSQHAGDELRHAVTFARRVKQLGGTPDFDPSSLAVRSKTAYHVYADTDLAGMLKENLMDERIVIQTYQEVIRWLDARDPTSRRIFERVLEQEEYHAGDLRDMLGPPAGLTLDRR